MLHKTFTHVPFLFKGHMSFSCSVPSVQNKSEYYLVTKDIACNGLKGEVEFEITEVSDQQKLGCQSV